MTVNNEKWQEIAEKYDTKAKWADAILLLNLEDHEDLISALIDLDPQDLLDDEEDDTPRYQVSSVSRIDTIDTSKLEHLYTYRAPFTKVEEFMEEAKDKLAEAERKSDEALYQVEKLLSRPRDITFNSTYSKVSTEGLIKVINQELERGLRSR